MAMRALAETEHVMIEGAAGVALAGLAQRAHALRGRTVAVVLCGRNIEWETYIAAVSWPGVTTHCW